MSDDEGEPGDLFTPGGGGSTQDPDYTPSHSGGNFGAISGLFDIVGK